MEIYFKKAEMVWGSAACLYTITDHKHIKLKADTVIYFATFIVGFASSSCLKPVK